MRLAALWVIGPTFMVPAGSADADTGHTEPRITAADFIGFAPTASARV